ncbi:VanZ family protein [Kribbella sandramycini]|uniref:VanZ family protein n=1 Tax=Kribbella sandramycini TaxID=60450 RepID=A0A7Y4KWN1_9ACTN|nr:VanZ family protein [Kribbella sandramycini]MBB6567384.1 VanZ family protein [Kribbella sandramycini]NOL40003.1 VanZ family protein [Kribbella sandramycini]
MTATASSVWVWRAAFAVACALQLYGVYSPGSPGPEELFPGIDKIAHFGLFAAVAFTGLKVGVPARWLLVALVANTVASELVQHYLLPHRDGDVFDALADLIGVAVGAWAGWAVVRRSAGTT